MKWFPENFVKIRIKFIVSLEYDVFSLLKSKHPMFSRMEMAECMESDLCSTFRLEFVAIDTVLEFLGIFFMHKRVKLYLRIWLEFRASNVFLK